MKIYLRSHNKDSECRKSSTQSYGKSLKFIVLCFSYKSWPPSVMDLKQRKLMIKLHVKSLGMSIEVNKQIQHNNKK